MARFLVCILTVSLVLASCSNTNNSSYQEESGKKLTLNLITEPFSLHPGVANDNTSFSVLQQTFEGLTRIGRDDKPHPAMAKEIDISEDQKTYWFKLRKASWSNGDPVTAYDFEYAWKWVLNPKNESQYAYQLYYIKNAAKANAGDISLEEIGVTAVNDHTLKVELENPTPYFLELVSFVTYYPVNRKVAEEHPKWYTDAAYTTSNGPFYMTRWEHNDHILLKKNENYWDRDEVKLDEIEMVMINDSNTELAMFQNGELSWAGAPTGSISTEAIPTLKKEGYLTIKPTSGTYWYKFQTEKEPVNNVHIRKALTYAINRQAIVDHLTQGEQIPAMAAVPPSIMPGNEKGYFKDNDVKKARAFLQKGLHELGYDGVEELPPITISYNTSESHAKLVQAIQQMWKENLGVKSELRNAEWAVYIDQLHQGDFQVARMGWMSDFNDPINFLELFQTKGGNNDTRWTNSTFQNLLERSRKELQPEKRMELLQQAEAILMDEMPIAPIYFYTSVWIQDPQLKGVHTSSLGSIQFKWAYFENDQRLRSK